MTLHSLARLSRLAMLVVAALSAASCTSTSPEPALTHPAGTVRVDNTEAGRPFAVRVSRQGVLLVGEQDNARLGRYDLPMTTMATVVPVGVDPADMGFSVDGNTAFVANLPEANVGVINVSTNTQTATIPMPGSPFRIAMEPDGSKVYATTHNGFLVTINAATRATTQLALTGPLNGIAIHPTQPLLYVSSTSGTVYEVSRTSGQVTRSFNEPGTPQEVVVSVDGSRLYIAREGSDLDVRATSDLSRVQTVPAVVGAFGMAVSPDNAELYISQPGQSQVVVLNRETLTIVHTFVGGSPRRITFDARGATAIIGNESNYVTFVR